jgi:hypothetical protein
MRVADRDQGQAPHADGSSDRAPARSLRAEADAQLVGGRYRVQGELGRGGMGVVYRVQDVGSGRLLALKQLLARADSRNAERAVVLFEREFYTLAQLAHPHVIEVYDYGLDAAGPFYTMELLDGGDLKALAPIPFERACALMLEVCSSLALLHSRRLVHRDITPRNVRCTHDGHAKLIDFGAMVPMGPCAHVVGTPAFIAPEAAHGLSLDARTDLFSLGATLYFALTGRTPFSVRELGELREAWSRELVPPSRLVEGIPPALDALCTSLLRIDPAQRPHSAFEVVHRLQTIAAVERVVPVDVSQAYLATPALIGREAPLRSFRQRMRRALHRSGGAIAFDGASGLGRSRLLDACVLEAKTLGATVLHARAAGNGDAQFGVVQHLAEQLLRTLPEGARAAAASVGVHDMLLPDAPQPAPGALPQLRVLDDPALDRVALQAALTRWLLRVCETHALLIAVDDVARVDETSLAWLAGLALQASEQRLLIAVTIDRSASERASPALAVLLRSCISASLVALTHAQTESLFASVFGQVPQLQLLADRIHKIALGNPRASLALAQHLVDRGVIRHEDGHWTLPVELEARDLPQSAADALLARIAALPPLARHLAEAQALLVTRALRRQDYAALAPEADARQLDEAIDALLLQELVQSDGEYYALAHRSVDEALRAQLDPEPMRAHHLALCAFYQGRPGTHPYLVARHLIAAGRDAQALDLLASSEDLLSSSDTAVTLQVDNASVRALLLRALELAIEMRRPAREEHELRRRLCMLAMFDDDGLFAKVAPAFLARLELDSGLHDYRALDATLDPATRLQRALIAAAGRYAATPEAERVYRVDEAIKHLAAGYAAPAVMVALQDFDVALLSKIPELLAPFAVISPLLSAIWQNMIALNEAVCLARPLSAQRRWIDVYEAYGKIPPDPSTTRYREAARHAIAHGIARIAAGFGHEAAFEWAALLDGDQLQRVNAMNVRATARLMQGDSEAAERFRREGELLALHASTPQMFDHPLPGDLQACALCRDLAGTKRVLDRIEALAAKHPGWVCQKYLALGHFELLRGDLEAAREAFEHSMELTSPEQAQPTQINVWIWAATGLIATLTEQDRADAALLLGEKTLATCHELAVEVLWHDPARELALVEAKLARFVQANARIDAVIEDQQRLGVRGLSLGASFQARARIAVWAHDSVAASRYATLAVQARGGSAVSAMGTHLERLLEEARDAGLELTLQPSAFEVSVLGATRVRTVDPHHARVAAELAGCDSAHARAERALALLCDAGDAARGHLYLADTRGELAHAASRAGAAPDAELTRFARGFFAQQMDEQEMSQMFTQATQMMSLPGAASFIDVTGKEHRVLMLTCKRDSVLVYVGLALLEAKSNARQDPETILLTSAVAAALAAGAESAGKRFAVTRA